MKLWRINNWKSKILIIALLIEMFHYFDDVYAKFLLLVTLTEELS